MDTLAIYAITAGSILLGLVFIRLLSPIGIIEHLIYITVNSILVLFRGTSIENVARRAGSLSLINMVLLLGAGHLSYAADLLGVSLARYRKMHRAAGWMTIGLAVLHVGAIGFDLKSSSTQLSTRGIFTIIAVASLGALTLMSLPFARNISYEFFLRSHQGLTIVAVYGLWRHIPKRELLPWLYLIIGISAFAATSGLFFAGLLYRNGIFSGNRCPRAILSRHGHKSIETSTTPFKVRLLLPRPINVKAGQYINLWLPAVSFWSWTQTHPFTVISWSQEKQSVLELLVQPRKGLTGTIGRQLRTIGSEGYSSMALYSGPHSLSERVNDYQYVLLVSSDSRLSAVLPYARKLIQGYKTCTLRVRRVHLVWQVENRGRSLKSVEEEQNPTNKVEIAVIAQEHINNLLKEDIPNNGYVRKSLHKPKESNLTSEQILSVSIYMGKNPSLLEKLSFRNHKRACFYEGAPDYEDIVISELSEKNPTQEPSLQIDRGEMLLLTSASGDIRDRLQEIVRRHLDQRLNLINLEYQP
ncbi:uncharacterized protein N7473_012536 [Penicillium subrubescens]|uniref:uncharacterized protein n=1 Tax=Penicillium subrubescens TaxID=1316194 RepID=UPI00254599A7|nr:uncharacterized protein N7473_012536 [Penicillium subrubescens]KAJ5875189.1 hypothetical protein N7473_012536 [Penicillium subrubescens]